MRHVTTEPTAEQLAKLPGWAQNLITTLRGEREVALRTLRTFEDSQTESPIYQSEWPCLGEKPGPSEVRRYIQGRQILFRLGDCTIEVSLRSDTSGLSINCHNGPVLVESRASNSIVVHPVFQGGTNLETALAGLRAWVKGER